MPGRIEDYAMVGDLQTAALVGSDGSVDWLCFPRFDSPACFAALLGEDANGRWRLAPTSGGHCTRRRYRGRTLVLETEWETPTGAIRVIDCMPPRGVAPDLVRVVEGVRGRVSVTSELRIRFDYGHVVPWVTIEGREVRAVAGPDALWLRASATHEEVGGEILSRFTLSEGERIPFALTWSPSYGKRPVAIDGLQAVDDTKRFWLDWADGISYEGQFQDAVYRSLLVLKGLTYRPSGGIVAAATTSLPETLGGSRNWDYRYCWLRDSSFTLGALIGAGLLEEARSWQQWVLRAVAGGPADAQIMYGIDGTRRLPEYELPWLPGYEGASPVRIGNDAAGQVQGDVPGEVLGAAHVSRTAGIAPTGRGWDLQRSLAGRLEEAWTRPDNGIWESRGERQHFVYSKVMCWVAFDSLVKGVERFGLDGPVERWRAVRDEIHADVLEKGYDASRGTFTQAYGSTALDACALLIPRVGFLPYDDERVVSTVETIRNELTEDGLVLRYRTDQSDDGLTGREGSFLICSFWMVYALWGIGRHREAEELFDRLLALRNDVGLLSEEYDTRAQRLATSHRRLRTWRWSTARSDYPMGRFEMQLENKVAVVTGSSLGIGRAIALAFGREGASVAINYRSHPEQGQEAVQEIEKSGGKAISVQADVSEPEGVRNLIQQTVKEFGRLDVMVNNAGIERKNPFLETPLEVWEKVISVNLTGVWLGCQEAARQMVSQGDGGRIINVSSIHEDLPMPTNSPYCAAKGGVRMLMRTIAVELAPHGITVNNIAPGAIETPINKNLDEHPEQRQELLSTIPLGKIGQPEDVASMAVYVASDASSYSTGSTFFVDGGLIRQASSL